PVDRTRSAIFRQQRGMILDRTLGRNVEELLRHEQRDERHHLQVRLECLELRPHFRLAVGGRLIDRKLRRKRRLLERIGFCPLLLRRYVDGDDVFATLAQRLQYRLAEGLLAVHHDTHSTSSLPSSRPAKQEPESIAASVRSVLDRGLGVPLA